MSLTLSASGERPTPPAAGDVLRVEDLSVRFRTRGGVVRAVDGVSFALAPGERFGLVGESGSGKSTIALALLGLIKPPGQIAGGRISLGDLDVTALPEEAMRRLRMARIALIPQGALNSLNPVRRIKRQIVDGIRAHGAAGDGDLDGRVAELLAAVGLRPEVADRYPHELSGGMKQRVCIAMAIALRPSVIVADEPTSALDVVVQRQVMQTLDRVQAALGAAVVLIGHELGLMAQFVDRLGVVYGGKLVESGPTRALLKEPLHPYTRLLLASLPSFDDAAPLVAFPGQPYSPLAPPGGCVFHPRCPQAFAPCPAVVPLLTEVRPGRRVACHLYRADGAEPGDGRPAAGGPRPEVTR